MTRRLGRTLPRLLTTTLALATVGLVTATSAVAAASGGPTLLTGTVTGTDGRVLQNVAVTATIIDGVTYKPATTTTDSHGRYRLSVPDIGVPGPHAHLQFGAENAIGGTSPTGYADQRFQGSPICVESDRALTFDGTPRVLNGTLRPADVLRGRVTDSLGRGVGGFDVYAKARDGFPPRFGGDHFATTDRNGNYVLPRLNPYTYDLTYGDPGVWAAPATPARDGYVFTSGQVTVSGGKTVTRNVAVEGGGAIAGTVVDQHGTPLVGAGVGYFPRRLPSAGFAPGTTTVTGGTFVLHFLAPDTAPLCVSYRSVTTCDPNPSAGPLVTVRPFTKTTVRIVLTITS